MTNKAFIAGVGMIPFAKPGANAPYPGMAAQATRLALADAGVAYDLVQQAYVGYVYGDSTAGQKALYGVGKELAAGNTWPNWYEGNPFKAARDKMMKAKEEKAAQ